MESLKELRLLSEQTQAEFAATLRISQPAISKLEKQTDMYLSTLRGYIEAMGGQLEIVAHLPDRQPIRIRSLEDITA